MAQPTAASSREKARKKMFVGTFVHNVSLQEVSVLEGYAVGVDESGVIAFVEKIEGVGVDRLRERMGWKGEEVDIVGPGLGDESEDEDVVGFWFPGFVDTHIHASQYPNTGIFGKTTLLSWLQTYTFPLEASLSSLAKAATVYTHCVTTTIRHGTTTAAYFATTSASSTSLLASICFSHGQRAFIGRCNMDSDLSPPYYRDQSPSAAISLTRATIQHISRLDPTYSLISPILTPRFAPSCTASLLSALGALHRETDLPIQTHLSENRAEIELVRQMFPNAKSYTHLYAEHGLVTSKSVFAHCCHLTPAEVKLVKANGSAVSHCPVSNSYLGSGICPVRELLDEGITIGLGTDVSGGLSPSVLVAAREAGHVSRYRTCFLDDDKNTTSHLMPEGESLTNGTDRKKKEQAEQGRSEAVRQLRRDRLKLSVEETLYLATRGGAKALGLEKKVGGFEVGMEFDAQLIDLGKRVRYISGDSKLNYSAMPCKDEGNDESTVTEDLDRMLENLSRPGVTPTEGGKGSVQIWEGMNWEEVLAKWVNCGDERNTRAVWVKGRLVSGGVDH